MSEVTDIEIEITQKVFQEVRQKLADRQMVQLKKAERLQRLAAAAGGERYFVADGEVQMSVRPEFYHYWGQRLGYECWKDEGFVKLFLRDNPECRVRSRSKKTLVGYRAPEKDLFKGTKILQPKVA